MSSLMFDLIAPTLHKLIEIEENFRYLKLYGLTRKETEFEDRLTNRWTGKWI